MKEAIILHGVCRNHEYYEMAVPSPSNNHWLPWLQQKFLRGGVLCQCLEMPTPYQPKYEEWREMFERLYRPNLKTVVGHSSGAGFILKWLHDNPDVKLEKLVLVAPFIDPSRQYGEFLKFDFNKEALDNVGEVHLFISNDDKEGILQSTEQILTTYPNIITHKYTGLRHFCLRDVGESFEDIWKVCK